MNIELFLRAYGQTVRNMVDALGRWSTLSEGEREGWTDSLELMLVRRSEAFLSARGGEERLRLTNQLAPWDAMLRSVAMQIHDATGLRIEPYFMPPNRPRVVVASASGSALERQPAAFGIAA